MHLSIDVTPEQQAEFEKLEQLLAQRSRSALAGIVSDQDIDAVFDEEMQNDN